jgi:hypothetical protein
MLYSDLRLYSDIGFLNHSHKQILLDRVNAISKNPDKSSCPVVLVKTA